MLFDRLNSNRRTWSDHKIERLYTMTIHCVTLASILSIKQSDTPWHSEAMCQEKWWDYTSPCILLILFLHPVIFCLTVVDAKIGSVVSIAHRELKWKCKFKEQGEKTRLTRKGYMKAQKLCSFVSWYECLSMLRERTDIESTFTNVQVCNTSAVCLNSLVRMRKCVKLVRCCRVCLCDCVSVYPECSVIVSAETNV